MCMNVHLKLYTSIVICVRSLRESLPPVVNASGDNNYYACAYSLYIYTCVAVSLKAIFSANDKTLAAQESEYSMSVSQK